MRRKERKNAGEPAFCKKPDSPAPPPAKTLIWLAVRTALFLALGSMPFRQNPGPRTDQPFTATKHLGVFGEGPGEGVFAKKALPRNSFLVFAEGGSRCLCLIPI